MIWMIEALHNRASRWLGSLFGFVLVVFTLPLFAESEAKRYEPFFAYAFNPEFTLQDDKLERGIAKAYLTEEFNLYRSYTPEAASTELKQAIWHADTRNPFTKAYADLYKEDNAKTLQQCDYWGQLSVDLDDNAETKEWLLAVSSVLCMPDNYQHKFRFDSISTDKIPHIWLLQKSADQYQILIEGDGSLIINNKPEQGGYREVVSLLKDQPLADSIYSCGETEIRWHYQNDRYEPDTLTAKASGCSRAYQYGEYEQFADDKAMTRSAMDSASLEIKDNDEKHLQTIRQQAQDFVAELGFADKEALTTSSQTREAATTAPQNVVPKNQTEPMPVKPVTVIAPEAKKTPPVQDDFNLEKLIKSGALDDLLKPQ